MSATRSLEPLTFRPTDALAGERLDRALVALAREGDAFSRAALQRWIREGRVSIDGRVCEEPKTTVRAGMRIEVRPAPPPPSAAQPEALPLALLHVDDEVIVVDKAAGMVVHPAPGHPGGTLVNALLHRFGVLAAESPSPRDEHAEWDEDEEDPTSSAPRGLLRPGIVHRLDRFTSGVMVVARTERARESLMRQFAVHAIDREYLAVVEGVAPLHARFETLHARHPTDRKRFSGRVSRGKRAVTEIERVEVLGGASLVRCRLETGRTHQIRVHLSEADLPLLGDAVYGRASQDPRVRDAARALGRQALHARLLGFEHPASGERMRFEAKLPDDLERLLRALGEPTERR